MSILLIAALHTILPSAVHTQAPLDSVTETVKLRHLHPAKLARALQLPDSLEQVTFNFKERSVIIRGGRAAVLNTLEQIFEIDTLPAQYRVELRLKKRSVDSSGKASEMLFSTSWGSATAGNTHVFHVSVDEAVGQNVAVLITPSGPDSVRLDVTMKLVDQAGNVRFTSTKRLTAKLGERIAVGGMTDTKDVGLRDAVGRGERPEGGGSHSAIYVEMAVTSWSLPEAK